jgi:hypothetical protein
MVSVTYEHFMLSVIVLNVVAPFCGLTRGGSTVVEQLARGNVVEGSNLAGAATGRYKRAKTFFFGTNLNWSF